MAEVRGRSWEDPMPKGQRPRGVTPRPRSGAVAESARLRWRRNGREELPRVQGQGGQLRGDTQYPRSGAAAERSYPMPLSLRPGAVARRTNPTSKEPWLRGLRRA